MGNLVLAGATSGSTTITPSATGTYTITLPAETGTIQTSGAGFTTNGVAYASSTSALTTGSALTFDGTNLGVGTTTPTFATGGGIQAKNATFVSFRATGGSNTGIDFSHDSSGNGYVWNRDNGPIQFATNNAERARINASGYLKVSNTGTYQSSTSSNHELRTSNSGDFSTYITNSSASTPYGLEIQFTAAAPNNTSQSFCLAEDTANLRFVLMANGGIKNYQGNDVNLSDRREKTNFAPAKSYLNTICSIPVQTFNYIDQNRTEDDGLTLGVVAQDVQEVAPELVKETDWGTKEEPKMRLSIYQTDLQYALMKSIQELSTLITAQSATIQSLTERITALEGART